MPWSPTPAEKIIDWNISQHHCGKVIATYRTRSAVAGYDVPETTDHFRHFNSWEEAESWILRKLQKNSENA